VKHYDQKDRHVPPDEGGRQIQEFVRELTVSQGRIRAFIVSLMPGSPDVSDVLQETNLILWRSRARYTPGTNFIAWAFAIARLEVLHQRDRAKRLGRITLSPELTETFAKEIPSHFNHEEYLSALESCMAKLSDTQRKIIEARYQSGHSLELFAQMTGRKSGALRIALLRIRSELKDCITRVMEGAPV
jgi:RNA polymerase sigma-70 factor (ECF subfamily)